MRASFTYSESSWLSIAERMRRSVAALGSASTMTGSTRFSGPPVPDVGSHPKVTANIQMRMMAIQKSGVACPTMASVLPP